MKAASARRRPRPSRLRSVGSTGSPLSPEGFRWVYDELGADTWLFSTAAAPTSAPRSSAASRRCRSTTASSRGARSARRSRRATRTAGRSSARSASSCSPSRCRRCRSTLGDDDGSRYRESYFSTLPRRVAPRRLDRDHRARTAIIYGRSDATINRGGVRMGTSEIYRTVLALDEIADALVVDVPHGTAAACRSSSSCATAPSSTTRSRRDQAPDPRGLLAAPRPRRDPRVAAVPRTLSGKVLEVPVKRILGAPADQAVSRDSLANPEALDWFAEFADLLTSSAARRQNPQRRYVHLRQRVRSRPRVSLRRSRPRAARVRPPPTSGASSGLRGLLRVGRARSGNHGTAPRRSVRAVPGCRVLIFF